MNITPLLKAQMETDISVCESYADRNGSEALYTELVARYIVLDPHFKDGLSNNGKAATLGYEFDFRPELRAIASKLKMYLLMEEDVDNSCSIPSKKIEEFITRGEKIGKEEYHPAEGTFPLSYISGPQYEVWMNDIYTFANRNLKEHPLYDSIKKAFIHRNRISSAYSEMMGYLNTLNSDKEYWNNKSKGESIMSSYVRKTIEDLLEEDIERCKQYIEQPEDEIAGRKLYTEITGKYDGIISGFGNGLYQYYGDQHFYDPEIDRDTLVHNLTLLCQKMTAYLAIKYSSDKKTPVQMTGIVKSNKVFIVHGHDNEAKQEVARTLERGGFEAIILDEQPDAGRTIIEKIEEFSDTGYAVVLYTECDKGRDKNTPPDQEKNRARQNVVFEHGYLMGKLGRSHVSALVKGDIETPSDINGVVYITMDKNGAWKMRLAKNMQEVGLLADMNILCR